MCELVCLCVCLLYTSLSLALEQDQIQVIEDPEEIQKERMDLTATSLLLTIVEGNKYFQVS